MKELWLRSHTYEVFAPDSPLIEVNIQVDPPQATLEISKSLQNVHTLPGPDVTDIPGVALMHMDLRVDHSGRVVGLQDGVFTTWNYEHPGLVEQLEYHEFPFGRKGAVFATNSRVYSQVEDGMLLDENLVAGNILATGPEVSSDVGRPRFGNWRATIHSCMSQEFVHPQDILTGLVR